MMPGPDIVVACPMCEAPLRQPSLLSSNTFGAVVWTDGWCDMPMLPLPPRVSRCGACQRLFWVSRARELGEIPSPFLESPEFVTIVTLEAVGKRRVEVMHLVRRASGVNLQEVKQRMDRLPVELGRYFSPGEAREFAARFEDLGARVVLRQEATGFQRATIPAEWRSAPWIEAPDEAGYLEAIAEGLAPRPDEERELRLHAWWAGNKPYRGGAAWLPFSRRGRASRDNLHALLALCAPDDVTQRLLSAEILRELEHFEDSTALLGTAFPKPLEEMARFIQELALQRISEVRRLAHEEDAKA
ncbi:ribosomal protein L7/L12 [Corallococcus silvisoli]|uniref:ribosomal protein L7/L12 n=1 Tax=Corallococcus silvisoli TaxID=2697031 RepID=UPI001376B795|nr:ribosomal protein L7/L12 [Corallococcus silvisoli]NBD11958.1 hypothetical protein [Corallococcus silvisoli]